MKANHRRKVSRYAVTVRGLTCLCLQRCCVKKHCTSDEKDEGCRHWSPPAQLGGLNPVAAALSSSGVAVMYQIGIAIVDVSQICRKVSQPALHVQPLLVPISKSSDHKGVPQGM